MNKLKQHELAMRLLPKPLPPGSKDPEKKDYYDGLGYWYAKTVSFLDNDHVATLRFSGHGSSGMPAVRDLIRIAHEKKVEWADFYSRLKELLVPEGLLKSIKDMIRILTFEVSGDPVQATLAFERMLEDTTLTFPDIDFSVVLFLGKALASGVITDSRIGGKGICHQARGNTKHQCCFWGGRQTREVPEVPGTGGHNRDSCNANKNFPLSTSLCGKCHKPGHKARFCKSGRQPDKKNDATADEGS
eukprot:jgi/Mesvir1/29678/Mv21513-RA.1